MKEQISTYRADIDGLRALAILCVVLYHGFPTLLPGGFIGVDLFFVISGYLITRIIVSGLRDGDWSFSRFYGNRVKRIFPALLLVLATFFGIAYLLLLPDEFKAFGRHVAGGAGFVDNILYYREEGYFNTSSALKPLLHLWSLGVEEQFYIAMPLLLWGAWRLKLPVGAIIFCIFLVSLLLNVHQISINPAKTFFLPQFRFWEIAVGGLIGYASLKWGGADHDAGGLIKISGLANASSVLAICILLVGLLVIDKSSAFPGWLALLPVAASGILIAAGPEAIVNRRLLSSRLFVFLGLISFPLYLWHWPILSLSRVSTQGEPADSVRIGLVVLSVVLAYFTTHHVEPYFRFKATPAKVKFLCVMAILMIALGLAGAKGVIAPRSAAFGLDKVLAASHDWLPEHPMTQIDGIELSGILGKKNTLIYGDSLALQYLPRAVSFVREQGRGERGVVILDGAGYPAFPGSARPDGNKKSNEAFAKFERLVGNETIDTIVITGAWYRCFGSRPGDEMQVTVDGVSTRTPEGREHAVAAWRRLMERLPKDKKVYLVYSTPMGENLQPSNMIERSIFPPSFSVRTNPLSKSEFIDSQRFSFEFVRDLAGAYRASFINPADYLCNGDVCPSLDEAGKPIYMNWAHVAASYMQGKVTYLDRAMSGR